MPHKTNLISCCAGGFRHSGTQAVAGEGVRPVVEFRNLFCLQNSSCKFYPTRFIGSISGQSRHLSGFC